MEVLCNIDLGLGKKDGDDGGGNSFGVSREWTYRRVNLSED